MLNYLTQGNWWGVFYLCYLFLVIFNLIFIYPFDYLSGQIPVSLSMLGWQTLGCPCHIGCCCPLSSFHSCYHEVHFSLFTKNEDQMKWFRAPENYHWLPQSDLPWCLSIWIICLFSLFCQNYDFPPITIHISNHIHHLFFFGGGGGRSRGQSICILYVKLLDIFLLYNSSTPFPTWLMLTVVLLGAG